MVTKEINKSIKIMKKKTKNKNKQKKKHKIMNIYKMKVESFIVLLMW